MIENKTDYIGPNHLAIIMDGNGRWAKSKGMPRAFGHESGLKAVRVIVEACAKQGINFLTLYAFSAQNWLRPKREVDILMRILLKALRSEFVTMQENNIRLLTIGNLDLLPKSVVEVLLSVVDQTASNTGMKLTLALSYGSREEIVSATRIIAEKVKNGKIRPEDVDESMLNKHLYTASYPPVDLLIRTSGERRLSNFLLWQMAYAELYFTETHWPDFNELHLEKALVNYKQRERRFGKTSEQVAKVSK